MAGWVYAGVPYTKDANRTANPVGTPNWFSRGSLHRAKWIRQGPFVDVNGMYEVPEDHALVYWEIKQGTPEWQPPVEERIPAILAILPIDLEFVAGNWPGATSPPLLFQSVDPDLALIAPQDDVAVWFALSGPAHIVGRFRVPDEVDLGFGRSNLGGWGL
jgi:hypothetical protein